MRDRNDPKPQTGWAWSNWGLLLGVACTRKEAKRQVEIETGKSWFEARAYMEVWKCIVYPQNVKKAKP